MDAPRGKPVIEHVEQRLAHTPGVTVPASAAAAPCSVTRVRNSDVGEQAASLRRWDQVYEQLTPGRFVGTLHEVCFRGVQLFRETTSQSVHEAGGALPQVPA